ncbi:hypothetical protein F5Y15DRAFT_306377 [Xylariaceae sp. FL0016]|nr:hypothetical protein F5Y15DRAFT_306377 [Xylariaceae sp. FL0016]
MLRKKEVYTVITPIPHFIPRQLAIDILHSHGEVITLNPLVLSYKQIKAPRDAASDEYFSTWYEITERIQYIPGMGRFGSGKLAFNGCFHDMPWGLQSHIYVPMNVDLRNKYRIGGNQPGIEPPEQPEIGLAKLGVPKDGLYLREDIEIRCNIAVVGMVKATMKAASKEMVDRIIKKAELLDAGVLQAMIEDGKMKTFNPNNKAYSGGLASPQPSPSHSQAPGSPPAPMSPTIPYQVPRPMSTQSQQQRPGTSDSLGYPAHWQAQQQMNNQGKLHQQYAELPHNHGAPMPSPQQQQGIAMELPGDFYYPQSSPHLQPPPAPHSPTVPYGRQSPASTAPSHSPDPTGWRWSQQSSHGGPQSPSGTTSSRPSSFSSDAGSQGGYGSPALDHKGFAAELPTHRETTEEHSGMPEGLRIGKKFPPKQKQQQQPGPGAPYPYNPADYARMHR